MEEARAIPGFPGYTITQSGKVWSEKRHGSWGHFMPQFDQAGYQFVSLQKDSKSRSVGIHRLLLLAWVGPCPEGVECCHANGIKTDNRLENLRWDTRKANMHDAMRHGTHNCLWRDRSGENNGRNKLTWEHVRAIRYLRENAKFSTDDLVWQFDVCRSTIKDVCSYRRWKCPDPSPTN